MMLYHYCDDQFMNSQIVFVLSEHISVYCDVLVQYRVCEVSTSLQMWFLGSIAGS